VTTFDEYPLSVGGSCLRTVNRFWKMIDIGVNKERDNLPLKVMER
jgi:hypothetical protein